MIVVVVVAKSTYPWNNNSSNTDSYFGPFEQFVPQIDAVPKRDEISLDLNIVTAVQSFGMQIDRN